MSRKGLVLRADSQTAGRGRRGREWFSPPGNLYVSLLLRPDCKPVQGATLGFVAAVALGRVLRDLTPAEVLHKWPNDLLIDGRKMTGMSLEAGTKPDGRVDWLVSRYRREYSLSSRNRPLSDHRSGRFRRPLAQPAGIARPLPRGLRAVL